MAYDDFAKQLRLRKLRVMSDAYEAIYDAAEYIENLKALLDQRDVFIVENGLWPKFVATAALGEKKDDPA